MSSHRKIKIVSTGKYLPKRIVTGSEVDHILGLTAGRSAQMSGVESRHYAESESAAEMGAYALMAALERSGLNYEELDAIICASGTMEQAIPCTAALIQKEMKRPTIHMPCFDINSTCLSFVTAFDVVSSLLATGRFKKVAIVSTEIASIGLNTKQHEAYSLFGDGAAAVIVTEGEAQDSSSIICANMKTHSEGSEYCRIQGGGSKFHPSKHPGDSDVFKFSLDGRKVFKRVLENMSEFFDSTLDQAGLRVENLDYVIPHQASASGMELVRRKLNIPKEKYVDILANHGNMIAASIPLALHYWIESGKIVRGNKVMLLGTSAGVSFGALVFEY
jgi:3-oxoacyl-[acyl-carrier-protein] synthase-3